MLPPRRTALAAACALAALLIVLTGERAFPKKNTLGEAEYIESCASRKKWADLEDPSAALGGDGPMTRYTPVSQSLRMIEVLCDHDWSRCLLPAQEANPFTRCPDIMLLEFFHSVAVGRPRQEACALALAQESLPASRLPRACELTAKLPLGDTDFCREVEGGDQAECLGALAFAKGPAACAVLKQPELAENCLDRALVWAASKAQDRALCAGNKPCLALFGDRSVCGKSARERFRLNAARESCAKEWAAEASKGRGS